MYQKKFPFRFARLRIAVKTMLLFFGITTIAVLAVYAYITYSKDELVKYFPADTLLYASIRVDEDMVRMPWYEHMQLTPEFKQQLALLIARDAHSSTRNVAVGLVPVEEHAEMALVVYLRDALPPTHPIFATAQQQRLHVFAIDNTMLRKHYLVITPSPELSERMRAVIQTGDTGLSHNITLSLARQQTGRHEGVFFASKQLLHELLMQLPIPEQARAALPDIRPLAGTVTVIDDALMVRSHGYEGAATVTVPQGTGLDWGVRLVNPFVRMSLLFDEELFPDELDRAHERYGVDIPAFLQAHQDVREGWYLRFDEETSLTLAIQQDGEQLTEEFRTLLAEWLAYERRKPYKTFLPDGSTIYAITKNRSDITIEGEMVYDEMTHDDYQVTSWGGGAAIVKNSSVEELETYVVPCSVDLATDMLFVGGEVLAQVPVLGKFAQKATFSTYPQRYPQFLLCIQ